MSDCEVMSVMDGEKTYSYDYHADGQLASANYGETSESFLWDGLALVKRGESSFINEPHIGGGNPVVSSTGTSYFNDMLGTTVGTKSGKKYSAAALTAFGEGTDADKAFFTGKPMVEGLGHTFLFRNYRASLAKWQTADPMGYPDGWNALAYCGNGVMSGVDVGGALCSNGESEFIWHEYKEAMYYDYTDGVYPLKTPKVPASTEGQRIMDVIKGLNGLTVTFNDKKSIYEQYWVYFTTLDEGSLGNYEYKTEQFLWWNVTRICHYAYYSKSNLLSSLSAGCTTVGAVVAIVSILLPELSIPASIGNGTSVAGFITWLGGKLTSEECKTLLFIEYNGEWEDNAKIEYWHRRVEE